MGRFSLCAFLSFQQRLDVFEDKNAAFRTAALPGPHQTAGPNCSGDRQSRPCKAPLGLETGCPLCPSLPGPGHCPSFSTCLLRGSRGHQHGAPQPWQSSAHPGAALRLLLTADLRVSTALSCNPSPPGFSAIPPPLQRLLGPICQLSGPGDTEPVVLELQRASERHALQAPAQGFQFCGSGVGPETLHFSPVPR